MPSVEELVEGAAENVNPCEPNPTALEAATAGVAPKLKPPAVIAPEGAGFEVGSDFVLVSTPAFGVSQQTHLVLSCEFNARHASQFHSPAFGLKSSQSDTGSELDGAAAGLFFLLSSSVC